MNLQHSTVAILNYNGKKYLEKFLPKVLALSRNAQIVIIDNGSLDDSVAFVKENYRTVQIVELGENYGFCGGYNRGLANIEAKYYILLNSDVEVTSDWLMPLIQLLEKNPHVAACQPKIKSYYQKDFFEYAGAAGGYIDLLGYPLTRGRIMKTIEKDLGQYDNEKVIFWATGACLAIRANLYKKVGGLDELFFAHMEEIDLAWRLQNCGYSIVYTPKSQVYHVGGGTLNPDSPRKIYFNFRNNLILLLKNLPFKQIIFILPIRLILDGIAGIAFLFQGNWKYCLAIVKAHFSFYSFFFKILKRKEKKLPAFQKLKGVYKKSIVWAYFIKRKKKFSDLF